MFVSKLRKRRFLEKLAEFGTVGKAALAVSPAAKSAASAASAFYREMKVDPEFLTQVEAARELFADRVEEEAVRRALFGDDALKLYKGQPILDPDTGAYLKDNQKSDRLLELLLKANKPDKYGDRKEINVNIDIEQRILSLAFSKRYLVISPYDLRYLDQDQINQYYDIKQAIADGRSSDPYNPLKSELKTIAHEIGEGDDE